MADAIADSAGVDADRIGALGICGGGGYTVKAVQTDQRIKAVATLSMFNSGIVRKNGFLNSARDTITKHLEEASAERAREATGAEIEITAGMEKQEIDEATLAKMPTLYREGYIYYGNTQSTFEPKETCLLPMMVGREEPLEGCTSTRYNKGNRCSRDPCPFIGRTA